MQVEMLFEALDPSHASGGSVTFEPGARTAWHTHPRGQILESGLTRDQIVEAITHLGFYAGWSKATKAMAVIAKTPGK